MGTKQVEEVEHSEVRFRPVDAVISLKVRLRRAPFYGARRVEPVESALLMSSGLATKMSHTH